MRTHIAMASIALAVAALCCPRSACAQKFQEPTREELQMTSDPKAPGAPAVFLYREEITDNYSHYVSGYARIKILTEQGESWARVEFAYNPGQSAPPELEGRTIHADGTVIPLVGKAADLLTIRPGPANTQVANFTVPGAEVGSIVEYRWTIRLTDGKLNFPVSDEETPLYSSFVARAIPVWKVQQEIFVHKEHFYFNPSGPLDPEIRPTDPTDIRGLVDGERSNFLFNTQHLPPGVQFTFTPKKDYILDLQDVPAIPHPYAAPAEDSYSYQVIFFYSPAPLPDVYWQDEIKRWSKILSHASEPTEAIQSAAAQITAGADTAEAKARRLYDAVQALENTGFRRGTAEIESHPLTLLGTRQKRAEAVWKAKGGSPNDLALLYLSLARAAGLDATGMQVADRSKRTFDPNYLSLRQLTTLLVALHIDGKEVLLDPGEKLCPFGQLHSSHILAGGISQLAKTPIFTPPVQSKDAITAHSANLAVDAHGAITGTVRMLMTGPEALRWRQLNLVADPADVSKEFAAAFEALVPKGISVDLDHFEGLDTAAGNLGAVVRVSGQLGMVSGGRIALPAFFFSAGAELPAEASRTIPIDFGHAEQTIDDVTFHLPAGFSVESAPQPAQIPWPEHAVLVTKSAASPGAIDFKHIYARNSVLLDAKEYPALREYALKLAANDRQQLILAPSPPAAGN